MEIVDNRARSLNALSVPDEIKIIFQNIISTFNNKFPENVNKIILFGSYATGKYQPDSDIDVAIVLNKFPDIKSRCLYTQAIETEKEVDLLFCTNNQLLSDEFVYKHINGEGVTIYEQL